MKAMFFGAGMMALSLGSLTAGAVFAEEIELSLGHVLTEESHYHAAAVKFAEVLAEKSEGRIKVNIFPAGQLGGEVKQIQSLRTGTQDLVVTGEAPVENTSRDYTVFSFPYLFDSVAQANSILTGPIGREMLDLLDQYDIKGLDFISALERNVFTNGKRIETAEDMKGLKIRVIQGPGYVTTYEALGAQPTPMAYSELYMAMQNGTVDAAENSPDVFLQDRFVEVSKTYVLSKILYMPALILMSKSSFNALSPEDQALVTEASAEAAVHATDFYVKGFDKAMTEIAARGIEIIEPDLASFRASRPEVHAKLLEVYPEAKPWLEKIQIALAK